MAERREQKFDSGRVLTVSARDYCESRDIGLQHYKLEGVHSTSSLEGFLKAVPSGAEVVVGFRAVMAPIPAGGRSDIYAHYSGTALIPKTKKR